MNHVSPNLTSSSATAERPRVGDFKQVGHLEAKFWVEGRHFVLISMDR